MNEYDIKRGHYEEIEGDGLKALVRDVFGSVTEKDGKLHSSFGAMEELTVWPDGKKKICVDTRMNTKVDDKTAMETIRQFNIFLERATGFTAKERRKRATKSK